MLLIKESVLSLKEKELFSYFQIARNHVLEIFYDWPVEYYFWRYRYMITRLQHRVQMSIIFTKGISSYVGCG